MIYLKNKVAPLAKYEKVHMSEVDLDRIDPGTVIAAANIPNPSTYDFEMMGVFDKVITEYGNVKMLAGKGTHYGFADKDSFIYEVNKLSPDNFEAIRRCRFRSITPGRHEIEEMINRANCIVAQSDNEKTLIKGIPYEVSSSGDVRERRSDQVLFNYKQSRVKVHILKN